MTRYSRRFYTSIRQGSRQSAIEVVPLLLDWVAPRSVIDVGCGVGTWLSVFRELGVEQVWGVDGPWVDRKLLEIPHDRFIVSDLTQPLRMDRQFDLVLALEVAEHLPEACAAVFVSSLTGLGPVVVFSAAIPFQGGDRHVNEQWPDYWASLFEKRGYVVVDCIRSSIWKNPNVEWWYSQNVLLYVRRESLENHGFLKRQLDATCIGPLSIVHPRKYLAVAAPRRIGLRWFASTVPLVLWYACGRGLAVLRSRLRRSWRVLAERIRTRLLRVLRRAERPRDGSGAAPS